MYKDNPYITEILQNGKSVLFLSYNNCPDETTLSQLVDTCGDMLRAAPKTLLILSDFTGMGVNSALMNKFKAAQTPDALPAKLAVLGITGIKLIMLKAYNLFASHPAVPFPNKEAALDWLCK